MLQRTSRTNKDDLCEKQKINDKFTPEITCFDPVTFKQGLKKVPPRGLGQVDFNAGRVTLKADRKVPKVIRVVTCTFGFSTLLLLLLSETRYFLGVINFGSALQKIKSQKKMKGILLKKGTVHPVL